MEYVRFFSGILLWEEELAHLKSDAESFICAMMPQSSSMQIKWYTSKFFTILLQYIIHPRVILLHKRGYILYMTTMMLTTEKFFRQTNCCFVYRWATVY